MMARTPMQKTKLTDEILQAAIQGFEAQIQHIDAQIADLRAVLAARAGRGKQPPTVSRKLSPAGRRRIIAAAKRRWANTTKRKQGALSKKRAKSSGTSGTGPRIGEAE
jgi:hypothetical protein